MTDQASAAHQRPNSNKCHHAAPPPTTVLENIVYTCEWEAGQHRSPARAVITSG